MSGGRGTQVKGDAGLGQVAGKPRFCSGRTSVGNLTHVDITMTFSLI